MAQTSNEPGFFHCHIEHVPAVSGRCAHRDVIGYIRQNRERNLRSRTKVLGVVSYQLRQGELEAAQAEVLYHEYRDGGSGLSSEDMWLANDRANRRKDGLYKKNGGHMPGLGKFITASFPYGVSLDAAISALGHFLDHLTARYGVACEAVIHEKHGGPDHAHIVMTDRVVDANGIGGKIRALNGMYSKRVGLGVWDGDRLLAGAVEDMRARWASELRAIAPHAVIDHRSFHRRGVDILPVRYVSRRTIRFQAANGDDKWVRDRAEHMAQRSKGAVMIPAPSDQPEEVPVRSPVARVPPPRRARRRCTRHGHEILAVLAVAVRAAHVSRAVERDSVKICDVRGGRLDASDTPPPSIGTSNTPHALKFLALAAGVVLGHARPVLLGLLALVTRQLKKGAHYTASASVEKVAASVGVSPSSERSGPDVTTCKPDIDQIEEVGSPADPTQDRISRASDIMPPQEIRLSSVAGELVTTPLEGADGDATAPQPTIPKRDQPAHISDQLDRASRRAVRTPGHVIKSLRPAKAAFEDVARSRQPAPYAIDSREGAASGSQTNTPLPVESNDAVSNPNLRFANNAPGPLPAEVGRAADEILSFMSVRWVEPTMEATESAAIKSTASHDDRDGPNNGTKGRTPDTSLWSGPPAPERGRRKTRVEPLDRLAPAGPGIPQASAEVLPLQSAHRPAPPEVAQAPTAEPAREGAAVRASSPVRRALANTVASVVAADALSSTSVQVPIDGGKVDESHHSFGLSTAAHRRGTTKPQSRASEGSSADAHEVLSYLGPNDIDDRLSNGVYDGFGNNNQTELRANPNAAVPKAPQNMGGAPSADPDRDVAKIPGKKSARSRSNADVAAARGNGETLEVQPVEDIDMVYDDFDEGRSYLQVSPKTPQVANSGSPTGTSHDSYGPDLNAKTNVLYEEPARPAIDSVEDPFSKFDRLPGQAGLVSELELPPKTISSGASLASALFHERAVASLSRANAGADETFSLAALDGSRGLCVSDMGTDTGSEASKRNAATDIIEDCDTPADHRNDARDQSENTRPDASLAFVRADPSQHIRPRENQSDPGTKPVEASPNAVTVPSFATAASTLPLALPNLEGTTGEELAIIYAAAIYQQRKWNDAFLPKMSKMLGLDEWPKFGALMNLRHKKLFRGAVRLDPPAVKIAVRQETLRAGLSELVDLFDEIDDEIKEHRRRRSMNNRGGTGRHGGTGGQGGKGE